MNAQDMGEYVKGEVILKLKDSKYKSITTDGHQIGIPSLDQICRELGNYQVQKIGRSQPIKQSKNRPNTDNLVVLKFDEKINELQLIEELGYSDIVEYAELNYIGYGDTVYSTSSSVSSIIPNDYGFWQWWIENDASFYLDDFPTPPCVEGADVSLFEAWDISTGSPDITIAFLDSGLALAHEEFAGRIVQGYDFVNDDDEPIDDNSQGTNVTGLAAMTGNNDFGLAGVDWQCQIMPVKVLDENGLIDWVDFADGLYYAIDNGADIINISLSGISPNVTMQEAIEYAYAEGVVMIASIGNGNGETLRYPAAFDETIAVGATDCDDKRITPETTIGWGSNYGSHIDLVAPGHWMYSTRYDNLENFWAWRAGTAQATGVVSGAAALILSVNPDLTVEQIREVLRDSADDEVGREEEDVPGFDNYHGAGRLNIHEALLLAPTIEPEPPVAIASVQHKIRISPNPASDQILIQSTEAINKVEIFNLQSQLVKSSVSNKISLSDLQAGMYFIAVNGLAAEKLIINH